jgi:hypothetical protein
MTLKLLTNSRNMPGFIPRVVLMIIMARSETRAWSGTESVFYGYTVRLSLLYVANTSVGYLPE